MRVGRGSRIAFGILVGAVLVYLFVPLALMFLFAFNDSPRLTFPIEGLSSRWFTGLLDDDEFLDALRRTLLVATATAIGSGLLALLGALGLVRMGPRVRAIALTAAAIPLAFPLLLYALGLAFFYHQIGVGFSLWATIAGHIVVAMPFAFLIIGAALERFRFSLLELRAISARARGTHFGRSRCRRSCLRSSARCCWPARCRPTSSSSRSSRPGSRRRCRCCSTAASTSA